jgi:hypothetical protein
MGCSTRCWNRGPFTWVFALFTPRSWCGRGCGDRYWGDFYGDPPDCWDPCDGYGNFTGGCNSCGTAPTRGGCSDCGQGGDIDYSYDEGYPAGGRHVVRGGMTLPRGGEIVSQTDREVVEPARAPRNAARP